MGGDARSEIPLRPISAAGFHSVSNAMLLLTPIFLPSLFFFYLTPRFQVLVPNYLVAKWQEGKIKSLLDLNLERSGAFV